VVAFFLGRGAAFFVFAAGFLAGPDAPAFFPRAGGRFPVAGFAAFRLAFLVFDAFVIYQALDCRFALLGRGERNPDLRAVHADGLKEPPRPASRRPVKSFEPFARLQRAQEATMFAMSKGSPPSAIGTT